MTSPGISSDAAELLSRVSERAEVEIRRRALLRIIAYLPIFLALVAVTPLYRRHPGSTIGFGLALTALTAARLTLAWKWRRFLHARRELWKKLNAAGIQLTAALWGVGCALVVTWFELGWTSFVAMLTTCALAASGMAALTPSFSLMLRYLALMLLPSALICFVGIAGLRGLAIGVFFSAYFTLLLTLGRSQFLEYWAGLRQNARLLAMNEAVPGTVAWVDSNLNYVGVSRQLAEQWKMHPSDFEGKPLGFADPNTPFQNLARELFAGSENQRSAEAMVQVTGAARRYLMLGQKYSGGTEAVLLGFDLTERSRVAGGNIELEDERARHRLLGWKANRGELLSRVTHDLVRRLSSADGDHERDRLARIINALSTPIGPGHREIFPVGDVISDAVSALGPEAAHEGTTLDIEQSTHEALRLSVNADRGQLLELLMSLISSAMDAAARSDQAERRVRIELSGGGGRLRIVVQTPRAKLAEAPDFPVLRDLSSLCDGQLTIEDSSGKSRWMLELPHLMPENQG